MKNKALSPLSETPSPADAERMTWQSITHNSIARAQLHHARNCITHAKLYHARTIASHAQWHHAHNCIMRAIALRTHLHHARNCIPQLHNARICITHALASRTQLHHRRNCITHAIASRTRLHHARSCALASRTQLHHTHKHTEYWRGWSGNGDRGGSAKTLAPRSRKTDRDFRAVRKSGSVRTERRDCRAIVARLSRSLC